MVKKKTDHKLSQLKNRFLRVAVLAAAMAALSFAVTIMVGYLLFKGSNSNFPTGATFLMTQIDNREVLPQYDVSERTNDSRLEERSTGTEEDLRSGSNLDTGESNPASSTTPTPPANVSQTPVQRDTPPTGLPENLIITAAVILGVIGSATFVAIKGNKI